LESLIWVNSETGDGAKRFVSQGTNPMLMHRERRPAIKTLRGWAVSTLREADAICECEQHGWMLDRVDPHARERAFAMARQEAATVGATWT
jgi:hypothetical protein